MSSSAIPQVVAFLTRPLVTEFAPAVVSSAQMILTASLASHPSATFVLNATSTPPAPLFAASIGAGIPWPAWMAKLGSEVLLFYGPGFVKVRVGNAAVTDVWTEETQGSVVPISRAQMKVGPSPLLQENTGARLRAMLLSARVRSMRRHQAVATAPIRIPSLLGSTSDFDSSDSDSDSDYADSDSASSTSSKFTSYSNDSLTSSGSPPATPAKSASMVLPSVAKYRAPRPSVRAPAPAPVKRIPAPAVRQAKKDTTAYLYQGGVTRVMTGGVMLGPRHVVRSTRS
ncbi:hypothetical protein C8F04DRAFT_1088470 [Mycena alexandri]|uniref:Uncharacterized protein n=1 Tax=Mycena alexandri TaxID=1745969 RepID=A0AAD6T6Q3_9AGAR|nr:hypothetical protein C8F04DRAFT_1088470 [Mycena alexandri]